MILSFAINSNSVTCCCNSGRVISDEFSSICY